VISPTQRTLLALRKRGCLAAVVEKWNPHVRRPDGGSGVRMDLFRVRGCARRRARQAGSAPDSGLPDRWCPSTN